MISLCSPSRSPSTLSFSLPATAVTPRCHGWRDFPGFRISVLAGESQLGSLQGDAWLGCITGVVNSARKACPKETTSAPGLLGSGEWSRDPQRNYSSYVSETHSCALLQTDSMFCYSALRRPDTSPISSQLAPQHPLILPRSSVRLTLKTIRYSGGQAFGDLHHVDDLLI